MSLLQLMTSALKATAAFYLALLFFDFIGLLAIPERAYTTFGVLTAFMFFSIIMLQLPNNNNSKNNSNNKSGEKAAKAVS